MDPWIGRIIGAYVVGRELGQGSLGAVYAGSESLTGRPVAIKILRADALHPSLHNQFVREMRTVATCDHPHLLALLDVGVAAQQPYLVSEVVNGGNMRGLLGRFSSGTTMPLALGLELLRQAGGEVDGRRRLADAALLVGDGDHAGRRAAVRLRSRQGGSR